MNKLIFGNLVYRPLRSLLSLTAVAIEVVMIISVTAIMLGFSNDSKARTNGIGADLMVRPANTSFMVGVSGAPVSAKVANVLAGLPHVTVAAPVTVQLTVGKSLENIFGIDYESFNALKPFVFLSGGPFQHPFDVIVDDVEARSGKGAYKVGDEISIMNHQFRICGVVEHGKGGRKFIPLTTLDQLMGSEGKASFFYLKLDQMSNAALVEQEIHNTPGMKGYQVQTIQEIVSQVTPERLPGVAPAINTVIGIACIIGFLVIFQSMYLAVMERTREIGVLKALGASKPYIVSAILRETGMLAVGGIVLGILLSYVARAVVTSRFPTIAFPITAHWILWATILSLVSALIGAIYPAYKAARKDPIDALAYE
ncbi:MAG TPA: FtsX-like permease family protein [Acidobacteriaceae bacterium]|nr:FtsX-like permease family protein [Terriglobia bacterium]HVC89331.1 FtsX-like permease family protein [Acidobacteriaceae bacterium]